MYFILYNVYVSLENHLGKIFMWKWDIEAIEHGVWIEISKITNFRLHRLAQRWD